MSDGCGDTVSHGDVGKPFCLAARPSARCVAPRTGGEHYLWGEAVTIELGTADGNFVVDAAKADDTGGRGQLLSQTHIIPENAEIFIDNRVHKHSLFLNFSESNKSGCDCAGAAFEICAEILFCAAFIEH